MASWEDGPEYAPLERPAEFDPADTAPLDVAPPFEQPAALAPHERPQFDGPDVQLAPLATLVPEDTAEHRDPNRPFDVVSSTMTEASSGPGVWGAVRGNGGVGGAGGDQQTSGWGPPTGMPAVAPAAQPSGPANGYGNGPTVPTGPWPVATDPMDLYAGPAPVQNGFPAPGTNHWFGPGSPQPNAAPIKLDARTLIQAVTVPVVVFLALTIIPLLSPIFFGIAWGLSSRISVARRWVLRSFGLALAGIVLFFLIFLGASDGTTGGYTIFTRCVMVFSLLELVTVFLLVGRALRQRPPAPPYGGGGYPPPPSPWG